MIETRKDVFAKETPLSQAKEINGLRAMFDEVGIFGLKESTPTFAVLNCTHFLVFHLKVRLLFFEVAEKCIYFLEFLED